MSDFGLFENLMMVLPCVIVVGIALCVAVARLGGAPRRCSIAAGWMMFAPLGVVLAIFLVGMIGNATS
jgi:ABC-type sulfate transport system permease component